MNINNKSILFFLSFILLLSLAYVSKTDFPYDSKFDNHFFRNLTNAAHEHDDITDSEELFYEAETSEEETDDEEIIDEEAIDEETINEEAIDEEAIDEEAIDEEAIDEEIIDDAETEDNEQIENPDSEAPAQDKEIGEADLAQEESPDEEDSIQINEQAAALPPEQLGDMINSTEFKIASYATILDSESIVVYNFTEFKKALSEDNKYVNIYLGNDIEMEILGIEINTAKKRVMISGINPIDGSGPYTINEYNSLDPVYTIRVASNNGTKEVIMRDVNIIGRNYYGAVCAFDVTSGVTITFENVNYNGPQISYNRNGTVRITGNSWVRIIDGNGLSRAQELAEVNGLELGGNTVIDHYAPVLSALWLVGSGSYVKILPGARVTWNETGTYMIYQDNLTPAQFIMERDSELTINTLNEIFYNRSELYHQFGDIIIGNGASLSIIQGPDPTSLPIVKAKKSVQVLDDASLIIASSGAPELLLLTGDTNFDAKSPDALVLYNKSNKLINWFDSKKHRVSVFSTFMNYWRNPCELAALGGFDDSPLYRWRRRFGRDLSVEITADSSSTSAVTSNYTDDDYGDAPTAALLNLQSARILTAGNMLLNLSTVTETSRYIGGETQPHAVVRAAYTNTSGETHTIFGEADSGGAFNIALRDGDFPMVDSIVEVFSRSGYKNVIEETTVIKTEDNSLMFMHVPNYMAFEDTAINLQRKLVPRADDYWHLIISDTRPRGSEWGLYTRLLSPLSAIRNGQEHRPDSAIVYLDNNGTREIIGEGSVKIAEGTKGDSVETAVGWPAGQGIHLEVDTLRVYSDVKYTARLEWILVDGP